MNMLKVEMLHEGMPQTKCQFYGKRRTLDKFCQHITNNIGMNQKTPDTWMSYHKNIPSLIKEYQEYNIISKDSNTM